MPVAPVADRDCRARLFGNRFHARLSLLTLARGEVSLGPRSSWRSAEVNATIGDFPLLMTNADRFSGGEVNRTGVWQ